MKTILVLLAVVTTLTTNARTPRPMVLEASIQEIHLDEKSQLNELNSMGGTVKVDYLEKTLSVNLYHAPECPVGFACPEVLYVHEIALENFTTKVDSCGVRTFKAVEDMIPVDGERKELEIIDYRGNRCPTIMIYPFYSTQIRYTVKYYDRFEGELIVEKNRINADELTAF